MSLRISLVLVIVLSYVGIASAWFVKNPPIGAAVKEDLPFFYTLSPDDIRRVEIKTPTSNESFTATFAQDGSGASVWYFDDPVGIPVNFDRWGGITFLLGGPQTQRVLAESIDDPSRYGLDRPLVDLTLTLRDGSLRTLKLGLKSPDGAGHYAQMVGFPQLVLVDSSWGDVLSRLADEPPYPLWYYTFDVTRVHEILYYLEDEVVRGFSYDDDNSQWDICDIPISGDPCVGTVPFDLEKINVMLDLLAHPKFTRVELVARTTEQGNHEEYGLDIDAPYITIRIETVKANGVTEVTMTTLTLGSLTPDETEMYVLANEQPTVARVDASWGNQVRSLFDDPAYGPQG